MQFLGQVDHLEIQAERANDVDRIVEAQGVENRVDLAFLNAPGVAALTPRERA